MGYFPLSRRAEIIAEIQRKRERLALYYAREKLLLEKSGVKSYGVGTHNVTRFDTSLKDIWDAIARLEREIRELEAMLQGRRARLAVGVIPRDI